MAKHTLDSILNKEYGKTGILLAHGPSWIDSIENIINLSNTKETIATFSCGEPDVIFSNMKVSIPMDYWVTANSLITIDACADRFNACQNTMIVYADSVDLSDNPETKLTVKCLGYDQRHFGGKTCLENFGHQGQVHGKSCCEHLKLERGQGRLTIQEFLQNYSRHHERYSTGDTVALHMLTLAIITGCNPIYLYGVDLDYSQGYIDKKSLNNDSFVPYIGNIINDFRIINDSAKKLGINIYNMSIDSPIKQVLETLT